MHHIPLTFVIKIQTFYFNLEKSKSSKQIPAFSSNVRTSSNSVMPPVMRASTNNGKSTLFLISSWCLTSIFFASGLIISMCFSYSPYIDIKAQGVRKIEWQDGDSPPLSKKIEISYRSIRQYDIILSVSIPFSLSKSALLATFNKHCPFYPTQSISLSSVYSFKNE